MQLPVKMTNSTFTQDIEMFSLPLTPVHTVRQQCEYMY